MSPEATTGHEPRKLGVVGKVVVGLIVLVTIGLVVGGSLAVRDRQDRLRRTDLRLRCVAYCLIQRATLTDPRQADPYGQAALQSRMVTINDRLIELGFDHAVVESFGSVGLDDLERESRELDSGFLRGDLLLDAWGNPIYYRCPGPVHKKGWDLISSGPNGLYEEGGGDDLVLGEDVRGGIAVIESSGR